MGEIKTNKEIKEEIIAKRESQLNVIDLNNIHIISVEVLGEGTRTGKRFYRLTEEKDVLNPENKSKEIEQENNESKKEIWEWFYEYSEDGIRLIAVRNPNTQNFTPDGIMPMGLSIDEQEKWDEEERLDIRDLEEREKEIEAIAKELGISKEEIESISEVDLSQKIEEKEETDKEQEKNENEPKQLSEETVKKVGMAGMNEINLNSKIDEKGTELGQVLNLKEYTKLLVVHSYKLTELSDSNGERGKNNINRFGLIAQKPDGTYETIPQSKLELYRGENREVTEVNNKENVEVKKEECIFQVPGTNKRLIINQDDPYGVPDVYFAQNTYDNDGQIAQRLQDKFDGTENQDVEVRALFNTNKGINQYEKSVEEARKHQKAGCKELDIDEADGRDDTGHIHFNPNLQEQQNAIEEIMRRGKVSKNEAERQLQSQLENISEDITLEDAIENAVEEIEEEAIGKNR